MFLNDTRMARTGMSACFSSGRNVPFSPGLGENFVPCRWFWTNPVPLRLFAPPVVASAGRSPLPQLRAPLPPVVFLLTFPHVTKGCVLTAPHAEWKWRQTKGQSCQKQLIVGLSRIHGISFPWLFLFHPSGQFIVLYSALLCLNFSKTKKSKNKLLPPTFISKTIHSIKFIFIKCQPYLITILWEKRTAAATIDTLLMHIVRFRLKPGCRDKFLRLTKQHMCHCRVA